MSWTTRKEARVTVVVERLGEDDYIAVAQAGRGKDRFRGTDPEGAFRHACDWAAKEVRKDDPAP